VREFSIGNFVVRLTKGRFVGISDVRTGQKVYIPPEHWKMFRAAVDYIVAADQTKRGVL
jgi:hypothetical protein